MAKQDDWFQIQHIYRMHRQIEQMHAAETKG